MTPRLRTRQELVAWIRRHGHGGETPSKVHVEIEPGKTACGYLVPENEKDPRANAGLIRGAIALDERNPFWPSCDVCATLEP